MVQPDTRKSTGTETTPVPQVNTAVQAQTIAGIKLTMARLMEVRLTDIQLTEVKLTEVKEAAKFIQVIVSEEKATPINMAIMYEEEVVPVNVVIVSEKKAVLV